jgi:hypothetical protein
VITESVGMSQERIVSGEPDHTGLGGLSRQLQPLVEELDTRRNRIVVLSVALVVFLGGLGIEVHGHQLSGVALFTVLILLNLARLILIVRSKPSGS